MSSNGGWSSTLRARRGYSVGGRSNTRAREYALYWVEAGMDSASTVNVPLIPPVTEHSKHT